MERPALGLLLAAGAGRRMGLPKALVTDRTGTPLVQRGIRVLRDGGCQPVLVTVGAAASDVRALLGDAEAVAVSGWEEGMGASLRAGLAAAEQHGADRLVVTLVDLIDVEPAVVARLLADGGAGPDALARAAYAGVPGHPVLLGRAHWAGVADSAVGDQGARAYLSRHSPTLIECGDLATGRDADRPEDL